MLGTWRQAWPVEALTLCNWAPSAQIAMSTLQKCVNVCLALRFPSKSAQKHLFWSPIHPKWLKLFSKVQTLHLSSFNTFEITIYTSIIMVFTQLIINLENNNSSWSNMAFDITTTWFHIPIVITTTRSRN